MLTKKIQNRFFTPENAHCFYSRCFHKFVLSIFEQQIYSPFACETICTWTEGYIIIGSFLLGIAGIRFFQNTQPQVVTLINNTSVQSENERILGLIRPKIEESLINYTLVRDKLMITKDMSTLHGVVTSMYYYVGIRVMCSLLEEGNLERYNTLRESFFIHKEHHAQEVNLRCANTLARAYILDEGDYDYNNQYLTSDSIQLAIAFEEYEAEIVLKKYSDKTIPVGDAHSIYSEY